MSRESNTGIGIALAVVGLAVAAFALRSTFTETEVLPPVTLPDPNDEPAAAVVIARIESGGFSLLGLDFGTRTYTITVQFYAEQGCFGLVTDGDPWPPPFGGCASPVSIAGTLSGGGIAATGESIIAVDIVVDERCFETVNRGDPWPATSGACP